MKKTFQSLALLCACSLTAIMTSCLGTEHVTAERVSPGGSYKADLIEGDTGAVGSWISCVRVTDLRSSHFAHLLRRDRKTVFGVDLRATHVTFEWNSNNKLEIKCRGCRDGKIEAKEAEWKDVAVDYNFD